MFWHWDFGGKKDTPVVSSWAIRVLGSQALAPVKPHCQLGIYCLFLWTVMVQSQLSKKRIDWGNRCSGLDCNFFFQTALSTVADGSSGSWGQKKVTVSVLRLTLCDSVPPSRISLQKPIFAKKDPNEPFFKLGFSHGTKMSHQKSKPGDHFVEEYNFGARKVLRECAVQCGPTEIYCEPRRQFCIFSQTC